MKNKVSKHQTSNHHDKKIIACFSGLDPTGGAGIQADIETLAMHNCHCLPLITLNSIQDSQGVYRILPTENLFLKKQFSTLEKDMRIAAIKIGMLANAEQVCFLKKLIATIKHIPIVLDPIFASALGTKTASQKHIKQLSQSLLPLCTIATPNSKEAWQIAQSLDASISASSNIEHVAETILSTGLPYLLITGTHLNENKKNILHYLFTPHQIINFRTPRLKGEYHGSGCTLASAIAANIANKMDIKDAVNDALIFTEKSLHQAQALGKHQLFPNRI